tara:strand:- start:1238 stop:2083 length:846 start_codon:yes stop_codon:yes gene_type:complete
MDYIEVCIKLSPFRPFNEIVVAQLGEMSFDSFLEDEDESLVKAYILEGDYVASDVKDAFDQFEGLVEISFTAEKIEKVNWNQQWEENFDAVEVGYFCYVRAPFHLEKPNFLHEIVIEPKMSFGTGHHQTTQMMIELMESIDFYEKSVLDMGSGTGILAILAKKMAADQVEAIDIEEWSFENMKENFERNNTEVSAYYGGEEVIHTIGKQYDVIIANINKNILLSQFETYNSHLKSGGLLLLSGFYITDADDLIAAKELKGYSVIEKLAKETWCGLKLQKHG